MSELIHSTVRTNGIDMHFVEQGEGPVALLLHGFPESWYSWRHQLPALADAGFRAVAPDVRGYGRTDAPDSIESYTMKNHTADFIGLLDAFGVEKAVVVGQDWAAVMAWHCALLYPDRVSAVVGMSVPYSPRAPMPPTQLFKRAFGDNFFYMLYFQEPGIAEAELEADVRRSLRMFLYSASGDAPEGAATPGKKKGAKFLDGMPEPDELPAWLSEADLDFYTAEFERTGFHGALNRYRNMDRDWEELPQLAGAKVQQPALFIAGDRDPVSRFTNLDRMKANVPNLRETVVLSGCGHWTPQERPAEVNAALIRFLEGLS